MTVVVVVGVEMALWRKKQQRTVSRILSTADVDPNVETDLASPAQKTTSPSTLGRATKYRKGEHAAAKGTAVKSVKRVPRPSRVCPPSRAPLG